jgi:hypothetical protein
MGGFFNLKSEGLAAFKLVAFNMLIDFYRSKIHAKEVGYALSV